MDVRKKEYPMKAVVIDQYGGIEVLKEREVNRPEINESQVLIEMHATSVNPIDWKIRKGYLKDMIPFQFPVILGCDAAGVIVEKGSKADSFHIGDRVFARPHTSAQGTYAEYVATEEDLLATIPDNISYNEAASVPLATLTAWQCLLDIGKIEQGDKVLVHAGAGGVGSMAIQIAKHFGAYVATTGSAKNEEFLKELGADLVIDYQKQDFEKVLKDYDFVLDAMGGDVQTKSYAVLKKGGVLVSIISTPDAKTAAEYGVAAVYHRLSAKGEQLKAVAKLIGDKKLKPIVGHVFSFSEQGLQAAHALSESHHARGKIVIEIR